MSDIGLKTRLNKTKDLDDVNIKDSKDRVIKKVKEFEDKNHTSLKKYSKNNSTNINIPIFYEKSNKIKKQIEDMMIHHDTDPKKSSNPKVYSLLEAKKKFLEINSKEEELQELLSEVSSNNLNFQIHSKIDEMYNILERSIDAVQKSEIDSFKPTEELVFTEEQKLKMNLNAKEVLHKSVDFHSERGSRRKKLMSIKQEKKKI